MNYTSFNNVLNELQAHMLSSDFLENSETKIKENSETKIKENSETKIKDMVKTDMDKLINIFETNTTEIEPVIKKEKVEIEPVIKKVEIKKVEIKKVEIKENAVNTNFFYPKEKDKLFWCFYIIKYGFSKYGIPTSTSFENEKKEKFDCIEILRNKKQMLKLRKIKNIKEDIEDELANKERIGVKTFIALCVAHDLNIMFIQKNKCFEMIEDENKPIHVVFEKAMKIYFYETDVTKEKAEEYRQKYFKWESIDKPLKAISFYKLNDLVSICNKLNLNIENRKNKKDLFELIVMHI